MPMIAKISCKASITPKTFDTAGSASKRDCKTIFMPSLRETIRKGRMARRPRRGRKTASWGKVLASMTQTPITTIVKSSAFHAFFR